MDRLIGFSVCLSTRLVLFVTVVLLLVACQNESALQKMQPEGVELTADNMETFIVVASSNLPAVSLGGREGEGVVIASDDPVSVMQDGSATTYGFRELCDDSLGSIEYSRTVVADSVPELTVQALSGVYKNCVSDGVEHDGRYSFQLQNIQHKDGATQDTWFQKRVTYKNYRLTNIVSGDYTLHDGALVYFIELHSMASSSGIVAAAGKPSPPVSTPRILLTRVLATDYVRWGVDGATALDQRFSDFELYFGLAGQMRAIGSVQVMVGGVSYAYELSLVAGYEPDGLSITVGERRASVTWDADNYYAELDIDADGVVDAHGVYARLVK